MSKKIILLAGPTASGKSNIAIKLAKKINGEIINADSMQVYKEFLILSSRPRQSEIKNVKHHLYGFISIRDYFSAGDWLKHAKNQIRKCHKRNKTPIVVGGTGLYFNTITKGISKIPKIDLKTRNKVRKLYAKLGKDNFYKKLLKADPLIKNRIISTDSQRSQRAYEVILKTKRSLFEWSKETKPELIDCEIKKIYLNIPREKLLKNIYLRTEKMFKDNCEKEVKKFNLLKLNKSYSGSKLIGIKEINDFLKKNISLDKCKSLINIRTRQYAKRQNTWARGHMKNWNKLYTEDSSDLLKKILKVVS